MTAVDQTTFHSETVAGNCLAACVASICEIKCEDVPEFPDRGWFSVMKETFNRHGFDILDIDQFDRTLYKSESEVFGSKQLWPDTDDYLIVYGPSPRLIQHSVIFHRGKMIHDPHPSRQGLLRIEGYYVIGRQA